VFGAMVKVLSEGHISHTIHFDQSMDHNCVKFYLGFVAFIATRQMGNE
jgi:hypothetical protein